METKNLLKSLKRRLSWMLCLVAFLAVGQSALATDYYLRGDFNGWGATKLTKDADGWYKSGFYGVNYNDTKRFKITETTDWTGTEHWEWESSPNKGKDGCTTGKQTSGDTGITIKNTSNNGYIQIWYSDQSGKCAYMYTKYSLAGNTLFGSDWAADNTSAVLSWDGTYYTKTYGSQNSGTNIEFKVIRGRSWDDGSFGYDQYKSSSPTNLNGCGSVSNNGGNVKLSLSKKVKSITFKWTDETSIYIILEPDCTAPSFTAHPSTTAQSYCQNATATALSVTASGTVDSYQWYSYTNAACTTGEAKITSATSSSYTPSTATVGTLYYKCKVTGCNTTKTSDASGAITVNPKISFSSEDDIEFGEVAVNSESDPVTVNITTCNLVGYVCELFGGNADQFSLSKVDPAQTGSGSFTVKFTPKNTGNFTTQVRVAWSGDAKLINVSGTGIKSCTPPIAQSVSLSGCSVVNMAGSQSGYTYTLYKGDAAVDGSDWAGDDNAHSWSVTTTGTYTVKAKDTETGGCLTTMSGSANVTKLGPVVTPSLSLSNIHPYEVLTLTADKDVSWSLSPASETAYISTESGSSTIFKGAVGTYTITASANGCDTATNFTVKIDENKCN